MEKLSPCIVFRKMSITQTLIVQYRLDNNTGRYEKIKLTLSFNNMIYRSAVDFVRVVHKPNGRTLKHGLRVKAKIIAAMIIWIITEEAHQGKANHIFDWESIRNEDLTNKYLVKRGESDFKLLDETIYEMLTDPRMDVHRFTQWISEGPEYELTRSKNNKQEIAEKSEWDITPEHSSVSESNYYTRPKNRGHREKTHKRIRKWLLKTLNLR